MTRRTIAALIYFPGSDKRDSGRTEVGHKLTAHKSTTVHNTATDKHGYESERDRQTDRQDGYIRKERETDRDRKRQTETKTDRQTDRDADTEELFIFRRNKSETKMTAF